jgi:hypothetical protein
MGVVSNLHVTKISNLHMPRGDLQVFSSMSRSEAAGIIGPSASTFYLFKAFLNKTMGESSLALSGRSFPEGQVICKFVTRLTDAGKRFA